MTQFLVIDDHPLYREALQSTLHLAFPGARICEAHSIETGMAVLAVERRIDLILLDLSMAGVTGFDGMMAIRKRFPGVPILIVSGLDDTRVIQEAMRFGAAGFVPKASDKMTLVDAIASVLSGALAFPPRAIPVAGTTTRAAEMSLADRLLLLTPQQLRVLKMIRQGKLNKQIAHELLVGDSTVKAHVSEILRKLGVISRTQIVIETAGLDFDRLV